MKKNLGILLVLMIALASCGGKKTPEKNIQDDVIINPEEATIEQLTIMLEKEPENPEYLYYRGLRYQDAEDYTQAIADFNKSMLIDSSKAVAWFNRGTSKFSLDDFKGALYDYNRAIAIEPGYFDAYFNRGVLFDTMEDYESAIKDYDKVLELKPDYWDAMYYRGVDYLTIKKKDKACDDFKKLSEANYEDGKTAYQKYCVSNSK